MRDKLLFGTIGLLVGIVVMQWQMPAGHAEYVTDGGGIIAATMSRTNWLGQSRCEFQVLDETGRVWKFGIGSSVEQSIECWTDMGSTLPVPIGNLKFWGQDVLVTKTNEVWVRGDCDYVGTTGWVSCGQWPGGPVANQQSTWGKIKSTFSGKGE